MRAFWVLFRMRLFDVLRSRASAAFMLVFPVIIFGVVALVFMNGHPFERRAVLVVAPTSATFEDVAAKLARYEEITVTLARSREEAEGKIRARMVSAIVEVDREGAGETDDPGKAKVRGDADDPGGAKVRGSAPVLVVRVGPREKLLGEALSAALGGAVVRTMDVPRWGYVHYLFPGLLAFSVMVSGMFATGPTIVLYRRNRFLKKLATTPLPRLSFVLAQIGARSVLVCVQIALLLAAAALAFDVPFTPWSLLLTVAITLLGLLTFMGVGFVLACVIRTEELIIDLISAINFPVVFLSEIFFPLDALPRPLGVIGGVLPSTQMVRLIRGILLYGATSAGDLVPGLVVLGVWTVVVFGISVRIFRWHE